MRAGVIFLGAASLLALPAPPAAAQPPLGSRLDPTPGAVRQPDARDPVTGRRVMRAFAACLMRNQPRIAAEILAQPYGTDEQAAVIQRRIAGTNDCWSAGGMDMAFDNRALAGALAEAGLQARYATADLSGATALTPDDVTRLGLAPRTGFEDLGICVARRAPAVVRAWALSEPGSEAETAARRAVIPEVGPCVNQGQPLRADLVGLRAILSFGLYRLLSTARP